MLERKMVKEMEYKKLKIKLKQIVNEDNQRIFTDSCNNVNNGIFQMRNTSASSRTQRKKQG
jgi:hypothetical protein